MDGKALFGARSLRIWTCSFLLLCLLVGCGGHDQELVVVVERVHVQDPRLATDQASARVFQLMLSGLFYLDSQGTPRKDLVESYVVSDDGLRYRFRLRSGVRFHNGRPLTAKDVVWTFQTLLNGKFRGPEGSPDKRTALHPLDRVERVDDRRVDFFLEHPSGTMLQNLTSYLGVVPHGTTPRQFQRRPVGTGPFKLTELGGSRLVFERFENYWGESPGLERLILVARENASIRARMLTDGEAHIVIGDLGPAQVAQLRARPEFEVAEMPGSNYVYLGLKMDHPILGNVKVRRAIALAIDRQRLAREVWRGLATPTQSALPAEHWARHEALAELPYDPEESRRLLDAEGYPDPEGDAPRFRLTYTTSTHRVVKSQASLIQEMLAEVGIRVTLVSKRSKQLFQDLDGGEFEMFRMTQTGAADPDIYRVSLHSEGTLNRVGYSDDEFDRAVDQGARHSEPEKRRDHYLKAQELVQRDLPILILLNKKSVAVMDARLEGYETYPGGEFHGLKKIRWAEPPD